jgi:chemotaxis protein CheC
MTERIEPFDQKLFTALHTIANEGIHNAARGFSGLLGQHLTVSRPSVRLVPLLQIPFMSGGPESEAIGIYLRAEGDVSGQIMLIIPYEKALELVDLLMGVPTGTTQQLGSLERSALAEVGNQTGTFFLNTLAAMVGGSIRPTPPAVMVDMVGAILDIIVATHGGISENVLLLQADIRNGDKSVETNFWVIPDMSTLEKIVAESGKGA